MNALDLLQQYLRRVSAGGSSDPYWMPYLNELEENALPPRDTIERAPGQSDQGYIGGQLHPNALGIYAAPLPTPPGDEVIRPGQPSYAAPYMPQTFGSANQRRFSQQLNQGYFPGPAGSMRTSVSPLNQMMRPPFGQY